ncbi:type I 3-dehydroquinate dehydratase [uncultured Merdimonas sp.]|uniref:type I 3-dehydroquinate dehydratase n=1 Tax=uncultured Merdimonas sp. TaxID=2023269 RepID=UPI003208A98A
MNVNPVVVRNIEIGSGMPKVCVPIVEKTREDILSTAKAICSTEADLVEWRADWYEDVSAFSEVIKTADMLRSILGETPLLFTFRTAREGGEKELSLESYATLLESVAKTGFVDLIDVEVFSGDDAVKNIIQTAHAHGVKVIASNHDFTGTPAREELIARLCNMQDLGADILKIAVMPQKRSDVLTLLSVTEEMSSLHTSRPVITMSMGRAGALSRLCGEVFGSAVTFASFGKVSAPGQIAIEDLKAGLLLLHKYL